MSAAGTGRLRGARAAAGERRRHLPPGGLAALRPSRSGPPRQEGLGRTARSNIAYAP
jgi:hypothetical protein